LLAGKCFPDEQQIPLDPRLRSPDDILSHRANLPQPVAVSSASTSIAEIQQRYESEIKAWREYEIKVVEWKEEVTDRLEHYKNAAQERDALARELAQIKEQLRQQEQELDWFRQQLPVTQTTL
jgi:hypothetical protein